MFGAPCLLDIGDDMKYYPIIWGLKDPYKPISIMECHVRILNAAQVASTAPASPPRMGYGDQPGVIPRSVEALGSDGLAVDGFSIYKPFAPPKTNLLKPKIGGWENVFPF